VLPLRTSSGFVDFRRESSSGAQFDLRKAEGALSWKPEDAIDNMTR
jgi:hypothetical protein